MNLTCVGAGGVHLKDEIGRLRDEVAAILNASLDAVVSMDECGRVTAWNATAERIFGWTESEALGGDLADLVIPEADRARHREGVRRHLETGEARAIGRRVEMRAIRVYPVHMA